MARVSKNKVVPPMAASPIVPKSVRSGPNFLGEHIVHYLPKPLPSSSIVKDEHFEFIWRHLNERFRPFEDVRRVFNSREHGLSLTVNHQLARCCTVLHSLLFCLMCTSGSVRPQQGCRKCY
jgi:hypothetical protein